MKITVYERVIMNRKFDYLMTKNIKLKSITLQVIDILFLLCIMVIAFIIRFSMRHIESGDWTGSFTDWLNFITNNGGFRALADRKSTRLNSSH